MWLFVPETSLASYAASVDRLAALVPRLKKVLPAHNGASAAPERLTELREAVATMRSRPDSGKATGEGQVTFTFAHFSILTSRKALTGWTGPAERGGSGLSGPSLVPPPPLHPRERGLELDPSVLDVLGGLVGHRRPEELLDHVERHVHPEATPDEVMTPPSTTRFARSTVKPRARDSRTPRRVPRSRAPRPHRR